MLDGIKRLFTAGASAAAPEWEGIVPWAESRQYTYRAVQNEGFVIDGRMGTIAWRLEWGPSQRSYITGHELRLRADAGLPGDLQAVLMNRELQETMEKAVFEQFVEGVQTRIDNETPPEMRWLVMYPKLSGPEMPLLRDRYVALSSSKKWLLNWLSGDLTKSIAALAPLPEVPLVVMITRGRLSLRTALPEAQIGAVQSALRVFESALREARRVADQGTAEEPGSEGSAWSPSVAPGDDPKA